MAAPARKLKLFIATSLDGRIAGANGEHDWLFHDQDYGYTPFFRGIDTVLMGRKSYETAASFPRWPYPRRTCLVFTRNRRPPRDPRVRFTRRSPRQEVEALRARPGRHLWLMGGGELVRACLDEDLIDEMAIFVHPLVLGGGPALFPAGQPARGFRLSGVRSWSSGLVRLGYLRALATSAAPRSTARGSPRHR